MIKESSKVEEVKFHDTYYQHGEHHTTRSWFERCSEASYPSGLNHRAKMLEALGDIKEKRVLELGCGSGELTATLAGNGACVSAIDVSLEAVKITQKKCEEFAERVTVQQIDANKLCRMDETFDFVIGELILHHLNCAKVAREIARMLRPHGRAVFVEPLAHNPFLNVWRRMTPNIRTSKEWPLSYSNIQEMGSYFSSVEYCEFGLLPLLSSLVFLLTLSRRAKTISGKYLARLDTPFLRACKPLRRYSCGVLIKLSN